MRGRIGWDTTGGQGPAPVHTLTLPLPLTADSDDDENPGEPKSTRKARKTHAVAKTIEKNLNNINLKNYELEFEADPLFHKMSQSFDEGGAKGMLLANLGHYDGCKILLNSSDVAVSTRKVLAPASASTSESESASDIKEEEVKVKKEASDPNRRISLASFGELACFTEDVQVRSYTSLEYSVCTSLDATVMLYLQSFEVCPPLGRLYKQLDEYYGDEGPQLKVKTTSEHLIKTPVKPKRLSMNDATTSVRARLDFDDMDEPSQPMEVIDEVDEEAAEAMDVDMEDTENNNDFDFGGGGGDDTGNEDEDAASVEASQADGVGEDSQVVASQSQVETEFETLEQPVEVLDATASASDFFKSRSSQGTQQVKDDAGAYTMMIENALLRSATTGGDDLNGTDDYSYFDVKMLRNWAGPAHWKFPAVRKVQAKLVKEVKPVDELALMEAGSDGEDDESGAIKVPKTPRSKKPAAENKSTVVDFFATEEPDSNAVYSKQVRASASITMTKVMNKRHTEKAAELVFPVDSHLEIGVFFHHFMKPKLRFFKKQQGQAQDTNDFVSSALDAAYREPTDGATFEENHVSSEENDQNSVSNYGDEYDYDGTEDVDDELYSTEGLISASRVVEKIDVHYERFAKRVDVKKLKHNIWDHLEKETTLLGDNASVAAEVDRLTDDFAAQTSIEDTTFESVVQSVSDRVRPPVCWCLLLCVLMSVVATDKLLCDVRASRRFLRM